MASINNKTLEYMIETSIEFAYKRMKEKKWEKIYVLVDIHNTIFRPSYEKEEKYEWLIGAKEALQFMTNNKQISLILWTSSHKEKIDQYIKVFNANGIKFDYINENPEVKNDKLGNYDGKLYFNIGIDDKFGFDADNGDWLSLLGKMRTLFPIHKQETEEWAEVEITA